MMTEDKAKTSWRTLKVIVLSEEAAQEIAGALDNANSLKPCPLYADALAHMRLCRTTTIRIPWDTEEDR